MTTTNEFWIGNIKNLYGSASFQSDIAQIRAKALINEVSNERPPYNWSYIPGTVVRNAVAATFGIELLAATDPTRLKDLEPAARQIALMWEALAKLEEKTSRTTALLNAAIAYELAGYQANARCLARKIGRSFHEIDTPKIEELSSLFLQRLFLQVNLLSRGLQKEPKDISPDQLLKAVTTGIAAEGFSNACNFFLIGDEEAMGRARKAFFESEKGFALLGLVQETNLIRGIGSILPAIQQRSIWTVLGQVAEGNQKWKRYLKLLSRGIGHNILFCPSISELWPSQVSAIEKGLLYSDSSKVIKMPTSAGKTRIAELAIVHTLTTIPGSKCVYIAPYRALVYELEQTFLDLFGDLGFLVSSVVGNYEADELEELLSAEADILVMTPEKLDLLQRAKPEFLKNVRLFVLDEGQIVQDQRRGIKFELLLTRLKRELRNARFLFLSAVVPQETLEDFALWFNANPKNDVIITDWRPSIQRVAKFEWQREKGVIRYSPEEDISLLREFVPGVIQQREYAFINEKTGRLNRKHFPETDNKSQTAAELAFKFAELGPVLVFCSQPNFVEAVAKSLQNRLEFTKRTRRSIPPYFVDQSSTRSYLCSREWLGESHTITSLLKDGIAIHHGNLPDVLRKAVELDFRKGRFRVLVATNTLAQGVNLPIRTVIVHSCWRHRIDDLPEQISARDYWNIAGRAGRAGRETEGTIIHIVMKEQDEKDYRYYLEHREKVEEVQSALFRLLIDIVIKGLDENAVADRLDSEILALLVEEKADSLSTEAMQSILNDTLVKRQADRYGFSTEEIQKVFRIGADNIIQNVPDRSFWPVYSSTGLKSSSCEFLKRYIGENKNKILSLFQEAGPKDVDAIITMFLEACQPLPEMRTEQDFGGSYVELLARWLSGTDINEIVNEFGSQATSLEELARFIEDFFGYRLPWGISGFIRIAMKDLDIKNEQVSDFVKFFPTMVKFGVPLPSAAWALSAGIPFRKSAIEIAIAYLENTDTPTTRNFREWLAKLNSEDLHYQFGLEGTMLEDFSRMLSRSSLNPLLKDFSSSEEVLPYNTWIRGIAYEDRVIVASSARVGQKVDLVRDYGNPVDHNAIKVQLNGQTLGFLERDIAQLIAPDVDCGLTLDGRIIQIERARVPRVEIQLTAKP